MKNDSAPEPWLTDIAWGKLAAFLTFAALLLNQLNMAPIPDAWKPWIVWGGVLATNLTAFILNPKTKAWMPTAEDVPPPPPALTPKQLEIQRRRNELAALEESA